MRDAFKMRCEEHIRDVEEVIATVISVCDANNLRAMRSRSGPVTQEVRSPIAVCEFQRRIFGTIQLVQARGQRDERDPSGKGEHDLQCAKRGLPMTTSWSINLSMLNRRNVALTP